MNHWECVSPGAPAACIGKNHDGASAALCLWGYGTGSGNAPGGNSFSIAVNTAAKVFAAVLDKAQDKKTDGIVQISRPLEAAIQLVNQTVYEYGRALRAGVYLSGAIYYAVEGKYLLLPFGGAAVYGVTKNGLSIKCTSDMENGIVMDAIGSAAHWGGRIWSGTHKEGEMLIISSWELPEALIGNKVELPSEPTAMAEDFINAIGGTGAIMLLQGEESQCGEQKD